MYQDEVEGVLREAFEDSEIGFDNVNFIYIFGSYLEDSEVAEDIDICISLDVEDKLEAEYKIQGRVPEKYDISIFENLPLQVRKEVFKGELVYSSNEKVYDTAFKTFKEFNNFEPLYKNAIGAESG